MRPTPLRPLALVAVAMLVLSGCAAKKDPTAESVTNATGLGTFGSNNAAGTGTGGSGSGAGVGAGTAPGLGGGSNVNGSATLGGINGSSAIGNIDGSGTLGGIDGSTLGGIVQNGTAAYADQGAFSANNGLVDGGVISASPQYTDGTVYTDTSTYADSGSVIDGGIQPYNDSLFDNSGAASGTVNTTGTTGGSQFTTFGNQNGNAQGGGYSFPGDNGQPSYFATQVGSRILFDTDQSTLTDNARETLRRQTAWLQLHPEHSVVLEGHADERGTREYNLALGARRADAARAYMTSLGLAASRVRTVSFGKERPISVGSSPAEWAKNRRVDTALGNGASF